MTVAELRARLAELKAEGKGIIKAVEDEDRPTTEAEEKRLDAIEAEIGDLQDKLAQKAQLAERRRAMDVVTRAAGEMVTNEPNPATTGGFHSLAEMAMAVRRATPGGGNAVEVDARLMGAQPSDPHRETGSTDGYLVPTEYRDGIWNAVETAGDISGMVPATPTGRNSVGINKDETTPWGSTGVQAYWEGENQSLTASKLSLGNTTLKVHKLFAFSAATDEILDDAPRLEAQLTTMAGRAIAWKQSEALVDGTGVGQPKGWMSSGALVTVAKESGQTADTIVLNNISKMFARHMGGPGSFWYCNQDCLPQLLSLTIGNHPAFIPNNSGIQSAPDGMLLGRPVIWSEHGATVGDLGDIVLVNPMGVARFRRSGTEFARSIHLYFDYGAEAFRWTIREGAEPYLSAPIDPAKGSSTKSHFVALAARA